MSETFIKAQQYLQEFMQSTPDTQAIASDNTPDNIAQLGADCYTATASMGAPVGSDSNVGSQIIDSIEKLQESNGDLYMSFHPDYNKQTINRSIGHSRTLPFENKVIKPKELLNSFDQKYYDFNGVERLIRTKLYPSKTDFVQTFAADYETHMAAVDTDGQGVNTLNAFETKLVTKRASSMEKIEVKGALNLTRFQDGDYSYDVAKKLMMEAEAREVYNLNNNLMRRIALSVLFSDSLFEDTGIDGVNQGLQRIPQLNPILGTSEDGLQINEIDATTNNLSKLFKIIDFNSPIKRSMKARHQIKLGETSLPETLNDNNELYEKLINAARAFSHPTYRQFANATRGVGGMLSGKPILFVCTQLDTMLENQNKFSGNTNSNEYSDKIKKLKEYCDIQREPMLDKEEYNADDFIAFFAYENCYFVPQAKPIQLAPEFDKNSRKVTKDIYSTYVQNTSPNQYGAGLMIYTQNVVLTGMLPNPFGAIAIKL